MPNDLLAAFTDSKSMSHHGFTRLIDFTGISEKRASKIRSYFRRALDAHKKYGTEEPGGISKVWADTNYTSDLELFSCKMIEHNPYCITSVQKIGFKTADAIALQDLGWHRNHELRHRAGNMAILETFGVLRVLDFMRERKRLELLDDSLKYEGVVVQDGHVWHPEELAAEEILAEFFSLNPGGYFTDVNDVLTDIVNGDNLNDEQSNAVIFGLSGMHLLTLTGGAGTGKTKTVASLVKAATALNKSVRIMAFAGKAAQRAAEALRENNAPDIECTTIHRALDLFGGGHTELQEDIIIVDEASMISNRLMAAVVRSLKPGATLVLVGDPNQLPPIGYGAPFETAIKYGVPNVHLLKNYRQQNQQSIFQFAEMINNQKPLNVFNEAGTHFGFGLSDDKLEAAFLDALLNVRDTPLEEWQVVTHTNAVRHDLNRFLQRVLNPTGTYLFGYRAFALEDVTGKKEHINVCVNDKVVVKDNDYDYEVFNGQTGIVTNSDFANLTLDFGYRQVEMKVSDAMDLLELGYCITAHKSQGSGWDKVIIYQGEPIWREAKRWFYTCVTRARNHVTLLTNMEQATFWRNVCQDEEKSRNTLLKRLESYGKDSAA
jgi:exodeoxyribonuclease V alpha subunit